MSETPAKAFLRPGKVFLLTLAGVLIYLVALVVLVPAGWLWHQASGYVALPPEVQVSQVSGRVWSGTAGVVVAGYPVRLEWAAGHAVRFWIIVTRRLFTVVVTVFCGWQC
ncbi:hypothetical protein [Marinobacter algicola]|uniref:hypothetical protein n=1 Tax=Marinobacter algicola TaxID=236100 RepID=UPI003BA88C5E